LSSVFLRAAQEHQVLGSDYPPPTFQVLYESQANVRDPTGLGIQKSAGDRLISTLQETA
jgi:hypothetical protein